MPSRGAALHRKSGYSDWRQSVGAAKIGHSIKAARVSARNPQGGIYKGFLGGERPGELDCEGFLSSV